MQLGVLCDETFPTSDALMQDMRYLPRKSRLGEGLLGKRVGGAVAHECLSQGKRPLRTATVYEALTGYWSSRKLLHTPNPNLMLTLP